MCRYVVSWLGFILSKRHFWTFSSSVANTCKKCVILFMFYKSNRLNSFTAVVHLFCSA